MSPNEVHIWSLSVERFDKTDLTLEILSDEERLKLGTYAFENDKNKFLATRYLVRTTLSKYFAKISPQDWAFESTHFGRPYIANATAPATLNFNLAHSGNLVICGISAGPEFGVDIENTRHPVDVLQLSQRFFSKEEHACLAAMSPSDLREQFFKYWTLKESYIKARGLGLQIQLTDFSFDLEDPERIRVNFDLEDNSERWKFKLLTFDQNYQAAVALASPEEIEVKTFPSS